MSKETDYIANFLNSGKREREIQKARQVMAESIREEQRIKEKERTKSNIMDVNRSRLKNTGVWQLLEQIRDDRVVVSSPGVYEDEKKSSFFGFRKTRERKLIKEAELAQLILSEDSPEVSLIFDRYEDRGSGEFKFIKASLDSSGVLRVVGEQTYIVDSNSDLREILARALLDPIVYRWYRDTDYGWD